jgi:Arc/MetJ-type ribon-helix-helix transcriptional regulator
MKQVSLELEDEVLDQYDRIVINTEFESVEEYMRFVLTEVAKRRETDDSVNEDIGGPTKEQLESLGYL